MSPAVRYRSSDLRAWLLDARRRTLQMWEDIQEDRMRVPLLRIINPPVWELGHVGWFQEKWTLRRLRGLDPVRAEADSLWDSTAIAHDTRWDLPLPSLARTYDYLKTVLEHALEQLKPDEATEQEAYFYWLAAMHEQMHAEAFAYTRQTLGLPPPPIPPAAPEPPRTPAAGDVYLPGGKFLLGARRGSPLVFDNEKWEHEVEVAPFRIARTATTNGEFAAFVDDGGYQRSEFWSEEGWRWRQEAAAQHPVYWVRGDGNGRWFRRHYDRVEPLGGDLPIIHVNWHEAQAYCRWARRRLPAEAEWEMAASLNKHTFPWGEQPPAPRHANLDARAIGCLPVDALPGGDTPEGCRQMIGNVWEWAATDFGPYPGFVPDPYKEYSEPWFGGGHKVLRGGCWFTASTLIRNTWRNFYTWDRRDVFAGFRTCAPQDG